MGYAYRDPSGAARAAFWAVWVYLGAQVAWLATLVLAADENGQLPPSARLVALCPFVSLLLSAIFVLRWVYRTNANAHAFGARMEITPGWAVGWFFIPVAAFVMPYRGMVQTWAGTISPAAPERVRTPGVLTLWWGLWLAKSGWSIAVSIATRTGTNLSIDPVVTGITTLLDAGLVVVFAQIIQDLTRYQRRREEAEVFA